MVHYEVVVVMLCDPGSVWLTCSLFFTSFASNTVTLSTLQVSPSTWTALLFTTHLPPLKRHISRCTCQTGTRFSLNPDPKGLTQNIQSPKTRGARRKGRQTRKRRGHRTPNPDLRKPNNAQVRLTGGDKQITVEGKAIIALEKTSCHTGCAVQSSA